MKDGREGGKEGGKVKEEEERREAKNESDHLSQSYFVTRPCPHLELVGPTGRRSRYFKKEEEGKGVVTREKKRTKRNESECKHQQLVLLLFSLLGRRVCKWIAKRRGETQHEKRQKRVRFIRKTNVYHQRGSPN